MGLKPAHIRMLAALARTGKASHFALYLTCPSESAGANAEQQHLHNMRRLLPPEIVISSIRGWGYELILSE